MAIQDDNTVLSKGDLKAYHEKILPYLGGNFMLGTNVSDYYSTDEKIVGVWTDGKPVYQKAWEFSAISVPAGTWTNLPIKTTDYNIDQIVKSLAYSNKETRFCSVGIDTYLQIYSSTQIGALTRVVLQYTKTTDAANSAATTPGCYDINRPDLWPKNIEIFFGNGLYGFRATGNMPALAAGTDWTNIRMLTNIGTNGKTFQMGGGLESLNANEVRAWTQLGISRSGNFESTLVVSTTGELQLGVRFPGTAHHSKTTNKYDVWVTYTK